MRLVLVQQPPLNRLKIKSKINWNMNEDIKTCHKCGDPKPLSDFRFNKGYPDRCFKCYYKCIRKTPAYKKYQKKYHKTYQSKRYEKDAGAYMWYRLLNMEFNRHEVLH